MPELEAAMMICDLPTARFRFNDSIPRANNHQSGVPSSEPKKSLLTFFAPFVWLVLCQLVGGFSPTHLKNMLVKLDHFPGTELKIKNTVFETTT